ncbi:hypothetical protein GCWU000324_02687 [Kingella oralis ATCC 51147]|uniref:Uncharacterized protein n=1 Tax=Kingella oralis ATCC 51147 TaxID=629741 RepID=C4GLW4_9NEIS|nr:hypothetical protein GCWU000324_02687 [Kingella oralis ATCC 51147]
MKTYFKQPENVFECCLTLFQAAYLYLSHFTLFITESSHDPHPRF